MLAVSKEGMSLINRWSRDEIFLPGNRRRVNWTEPLKQ